MLYAFLFDGSHWIPQVNGLFIFKKRYDTKCIEVSHKRFSIRLESKYNMNKWDAIVLNDEIQKWDLIKNIGVKYSLYLCLLFTKIKGDSVRLRVLQFWKKELPNNRTVSGRELYIGLVIGKKKALMMVVLTFEISEEKISEAWIQLSKTKVKGTLNVTWFP